jgi:hypothetical protein
MGRFGRPGSVTRRTGSVTAWEMAAWSQSDGGYTPAELGYL